MGGKVIVRDHGMNKIMSELRDLGTSYVKVGVLSGSVDYPNGKTQAQVAEVNEFGSSDGKVPERSFLRSTADERKADITKGLEAVAKKVAKGSRTKEEGLTALGMWVAAAVQAKIRSNIPPPNAPLTIALKKSSKTLVDTGQLIQSISYELVKGKR